MQAAADSSVFEVPYKPAVLNDPAEASSIPQTSTRAISSSSCKRAASLCPGSPFHSSTSITHILHLRAQLLAVL